MCIVDDDQDIIISLPSSKSYSQVLHFNLYRRTEKSFPPTISKEACNLPMGENSDGTNRAIDFSGQQREELCFNKIAFKNIVRCASNCKYQCIYDLHSR